MTIDELLAREAIRKTMTDYTLAGDRLRTDEFVAVFTEDGILETEGVSEADSFRYAGKDELRQWMSRWVDGAGGSAGATRATFIRHHLSTSQIELVSDNEARARTYYTAYTDIGPDHGGSYIDRFRKTGGAWLIAHRRVRLDWRSPASLYNSAVERTRG